MARGRSGRAAATPAATPAQLVDRMMQGVELRLGALLREGLFEERGYPSVITRAGFLALPLDVETEDVSHLFGMVRRLRTYPGQQDWAETVLQRHAALAAEIARRAEEILQGQPEDVRAAVFESNIAPHPDVAQVSRWGVGTWNSIGFDGHRRPTLLADYAAWADGLSVEDVPMGGPTGSFARDLYLQGMTLRQELADAMRPTVHRFIDAGDAESVRACAAAIRARLGEGEGKPTLASPRLADADLLRLGRALRALGIHAGRDPASSDGTPGELRGIWRYVAEADLITEADLARELGHIRGGDDGDHLAGVLPLADAREREVLSLPAFLHTARRAQRSPETIADVEVAGEERHIMLPLRADDAPALLARWADRPVTARAIIGPRDPDSESDDAPLGVALTATTMTPDGAHALTAVVEVERYADAMMEDDEAVRMAMGGIARLGIPVDDESWSMQVLHPRGWLAGTSAPPNPDYAVASDVVGTLARCRHAGAQWRDVRATARYGGANPEDAPCDGKALCCGYCGQRNLAVVELHRIPAECISDPDDYLARARFRDVLRGVDPVDSIAALRARDGMQSLDAVQVLTDEGETGPATGLADTLFS